MGCEPTVLHILGEYFTIDQAANVAQLAVQITNTNQGKDLYPCATADTYLTMVAESSAVSDLAHCTLRAQEAKTACTRGSLD